MQEIKPTYVSFEQSKWLQEKGFDIKCSHFYNEGSGFKLQNDSLVRTGKDVFYEAPEQWQVVEWLRVNHGIDIFIVPTNRCIPFDNYKFNVYKNKELRQLSLLDFKTPQEATSAVIDYILKELI